MLCYSESGRGETVILVHGMVVSQHAWRAVARLLVEAGYRVLAVDLPGHGDSPKPDDPASYTAQARVGTLSEWIDRVAPGETFCLAGFSLGGFLCLDYCLTHPERVSRLALVDPYCYPDQQTFFVRFLARRPALLRWLQQRLPGWLFNWVLSWEPFILAGVSSQDRRQIAIDVKRASPHVLDLLRDLPDLRPRLGSLQTPTLLVWGEHDTLLRPASFSRMAARSSQVECLRVRGARHMALLSHAQAVGKAMAEFFGS